MKIQTVVAAIGGAVCALLLREALVSDNGTFSSTSPPLERIETRTISQRIGPDEDSIRRAIREELAAGRALSAAEPDNETMDSVPPPVRQEDIRAANAIVSDAIIAGRWTQTDYERVRAIIPRLDQESLDALLSKFTVAVNAQKLQIEGLPP